MNRVRPHFLRVIGDVVGLALATVAGLALLAGVGVALARPTVSSAKKLVDVDLAIPTEVALPELDERSTIHGDDGALLAVVDREVSRRTLPLKRIPRHVQQAVIAAEDRKFYDHDGYDVEGIGRAMVANLKAGTIAEGGSTITQQLAKVEVGNDRTLERKASELLYALALEEQFSKDELLENYLNLVYFGARAYGVAAAAEEFFHTTPKRLQTHQSALLAALIRAPNSTDPRAHPRLALRRRNSVLRAMADEGYVPRSRLPRLLHRSLDVKPRALQRRVRQRHVVAAVQRELLANEALGPTRREREDRLYYGGLRITTTLDLHMQRTAKDVIRSHLPSGSPTAAIATVDPVTGAIKAVASGLRYRDLKYDLPTQGRRQPGSAFKPFVYAAALEDGFPVDMSLTGSSPAYFEGVPGWERDCNAYDKEVCGVSNYDGARYGKLDMAKALKNSVNSAAAQLTVAVGDERIAKLAGRMNIDIDAATNGTVTQSIGLGGLDQGVTPLELASAYAVFANKGTKVQPHLVAAVHDASGKLLYKAKPEPEQILDPLVNGAMVDMMQGVVKSGTGTGAALDSWDVAGKTGTTTNNVDAWFAGYTPALSTAVWVGHARGQIEMPNMTGGALPATIWQDYMRRALAGRLVTQFPEPDFAALEARRGTLEVTVPAVVGKSEADALTTLGDAKLVAQTTTVSSSAPSGTVVTTSPQAGEQAMAGDKVRVAISDGEGASMTGFPLYIPPPLTPDE